jgi:hypothetical protein
MISKKILLLGIVTAIMFSITANSQSISAAPTTLDVNKAKNPGPGFGNEKIGTATIDAANTKTTITANITAKPGQDKIFEAWLVDEGGSNYKVSLGQVIDGSLQYTANLVNPFTYTQFIITEEPKSDTDPNAAGTFAGAQLPKPQFGQ